MIRIAVQAEEHVPWPDISARLRGGTITHVASAAETDLPAESFDALLLIAPDASRTTLIEFALAHGKHVVLAAPTSLPAETIQTLAAGSERGSSARGQLAIVNPDHFLPSRQLLRQHLDAGKLGLPGLIRSHSWEPSTASAGISPACPAQLILDLELAMWLADGGPNVVYAVEVAPSVPTAAEGRTLQVHLGFPGGAMALVGYSSALPPGDGYRTLSVMGSLGAAYADDHQNMQLIYHGTRPQAVRVDEGLRPLVNLLQDCINGWQTDVDFSASVNHWRRALTVAAAVEQSLTSRQAVSMEGV